MGRRRVERHPLWSPRGMPDLRVALRAWTDAEVATAAGAGLEVMAAAGELYWVTADMTALAVEAAVSLPEWTPAAVIPSHAGMLLWDARDTAPMPMMMVTGQRPIAQVAGACWSVQDGQLWIVSLHRRADAITALATLSSLTSARLGMPPGPPVVPSAAVEPIPMTETHSDEDRERIGEGDPLVRLLVATWLLMEQPTIAESRPLTPKGPAYHRAVARDEPIPRVRLVDLRTVRHPDHDDGEPVEGRTYTRRWLVRGHWRQQACGPARSQRRPVWIAPHIKGPDGTPLVVSEHVNVWRR